MDRDIEEEDMMHVEGNEDVDDADRVNEDDLTFTVCLFWCRLYLGN